MARDTKVDMFMPFFVGDYLADTTDLTTEEHGAYLLLMFDLWRKDGRIEFDSDRLARTCRLSPARWERAWKSLARFFDVADGILSQGRLCRELAVAYGKKKEASESGKRGAAARWGGHSDRIATASVTQWRNDSSSSSSPSGSLTLGSSSDLDLSKPPERAIPVVPAPAPDLWAAGDWLRKFKALWEVKYSGRFYGMASDGKACGALSDLLAQIPTDERKRAQARASAMFAEFLAGESPGEVKARHPFAFFVTAFGGLMTDKAPQSVKPIRNYAQEREDANIAETMRQIRADAERKAKR